jgi:vacuolar-type H+-ATPase subunit F/Vma7
MKSTYYAIVRAPYSDETRLVRFKAEEGTDEIEEIVDSLDTSPYLCSVVVLTEKEFNNLKEKIDNPEDYK